MGIDLEKGSLVKDLKTVGKLIENRLVALDTSYLKVSYVEGGYWLAGFGSQHELLIKLIDDKGDEQSKNIDFNRLWDLVSYMGDDITLELTDKGVHVTDSNSKTDLVDLMSDNDDVEDIRGLIELKEEIKDEGFTVDRKEFLETIKYLRSIQDREERDDVQTGIMLSTDSSYVISDLYALRHDFKFPIDLVLDTHTVKVIIDLLDSVEDEEIDVIRDGSHTWFLVGENVYRVDALEDEVSDIYKKVFDHREVEDKINLGREESLRMLKMTKVLTDSVETDINFQIKKGMGRIYTQTQDGDMVDSKFTAKECQDVEFTVAVENMIGVISNLPDRIEEELEFEVVLVPMEEQFDEQELLHLKIKSEGKDVGECIFSINTDID